MVHQKSWLDTWIEVLISHHVTILQVSFRVKYPPEFESWRKDELGDFKSTRYGKIQTFFNFCIIIISIVIIIPVTLCVCGHWFVMQEEPMWSI
jgi:hypothetical protein